MLNLIVHLSYLFMYLRFLFRAKENGNLKAHWLAKCFGYNNLKSIFGKNCSL